MLMEKGVDEDARVLVLPCGWRAVGVEKVESGKFHISTEEMDGSDQAEETLFLIYRDNLKIVDTLKIKSCRK